MEAVLNHYSQNEADSLKYRAACFLIENMREYFSIAGEDVEGFRNSVKDFGKRNDFPVTGPHLRIMPPELFEDRYTIPSFSN